MTEEFKEWVRERHLQVCQQCQKEGKARLVDADAYAVKLLEEFEEAK